MTYPHGLRALNHDEFRRFYFSQFAAQVGSWMQNVAQAWLVLQLTNSPFKLGLLATLQFSPVLLPSIVSGAVADRLPKRRLLVATQTTLACQGLLLALLVAIGHVEYWHVATLGLAQSNCQRNEQDDGFLPTEPLHRESGRPTNRS